ncbi:hypothetical protein ACW4TU_18520 [Streptomyces sp. QTS52]
MPANPVIYLALAAGMLAGLLGWNHPDTETRTMCRFVGVATLIASAVIAAREWL